MRRQYIERISQYMRDSKTFLWMDQTKINLFYRKTQGRVHAGKRAVMALPAFKGPNVHVICPVSEYQMIHTTRRRGAFKSDATWVLEMLENLPPPIRVDSVVLVCDNAPLSL